MTKILFRFRIIRLTVIRADTCCRAHQLTDQRQRHRVSFDLQSEVNDTFRENSSTLLKIIFATTSACGISLRRDLAFVIRHSSFVIRASSFHSPSYQTSD